MRANSEIPDWDADHLRSVAHALEDAAYAEALPLWRNLASGDVDWKSENDPVTVADRRVEAKLAQALPAIRTGAFVGEESVHADPDPLKALQGDEPVWVVDPIDGTRPFVGGNGGWGVMAAFLVGGEIAAAWLHDPIARETFVGAGDRAFFCDADALLPFRVPGNPASRGAVLDDRGPTEDTRRIRERAAEEGFELAHCPPSVLGAAFMIARGELAFAAFQGAMPWDFLPVAGALRAAGGVVRPARPDEWTLWGDGEALLMAADQTTADRLASRQEVTA